MKTITVSYETEDGSANGITWIAPGRARITTRCVVTVIMSESDPSRGCWTQTTHPYVLRIGDELVFDGLASVQAWRGEIQLFEYAYPPEEHHS